MAIREDIVSSAVSFLQDPTVTSSPIENRIAFLQSKNLTQEEVDVALARAGAEPAPSYSNFAPQQQVIRPPQPTYSGYPQHAWPQAPPPEVPKRDWRDWFIMATVMGGVGYGLYFMTKRYIYPIIAPPTEPQLEKDKKAIDDSFDKAFALLDQLSKDTETLKSSEQARTERLDTALSEVETVIAELKTLSKRREEESRRISDEVRGLQDLIPKAMDGQKESTDSRLRELNTELKSLKTLMSQRMSPPSQSSTAPLPSLGRTLGSTSPSGTSSTNTTNGTNSTDNLTPKPASVSNDTESTFAPVGRTATPFGTGAPGRAAIPSWQMAAANKSSSTASTSTPDNGSKDANGSA